MSSERDGGSVSGAAPVAAPVTARKWPGWQRMLLQAVTLGAVLFFWGQAVLANWSQVAQITWQGNVPLLLASAALALVHLPATALIWREAMRFLGLETPARWAIKAYLVSQLARYVPGGIWDVAGRLYLSSDRGPAQGAGLGDHSGGDGAGGGHRRHDLSGLAALLGPAPAAGGALRLGGIRAGGTGGASSGDPAARAALAARLLHRESAPLPLSYGQVLVLAAYHLLVRLVIGVSFFCFAAA